MRANKISLDGCHLIHLDDLYVKFMHVVIVMLHTFVWT